MAEAVAADVRVGCTTNRFWLAIECSCRSVLRHEAGDVTV
jgi:hypothetical protein